MTAQQEVDATLWWRPIAALKFGLQYSYVHTDYLTNAYFTQAGVESQNPIVSASGNSGSPSKMGTNTA